MQPGAPVQLKRVIQRAPNDTADLAAAYGSENIGPEYEMYVERALRNGEIHPDLPKMSVVIPMQHNKSGHGIDCSGVVTSGARK